MFDPKRVESLRQSLKRWHETTLQKTLTSIPERQQRFQTTSSEPVERLYTPLDVAELDYERDLAVDFHGDLPLV